MKFNIFKPIIKSVKNSKFLTILVKKVLYRLARIAIMTYRIDVVFDDGVQIPFSKNNGVFYLWHQQIVAGFFFFYKFRNGQSCIVSSSKDGQFAGYVLERLGFNIIYGSSFKNPILLTRQAVKILKDGQQLCIVGDGSRGPAFELKPGVTFLAKTADVPLYFVECSSTWKIKFKKSWDQFEIPLPFSKIMIKVHSPKKV
ncbi:MAG: hypothetical protein US49_C0001G0091 [candidate division TM6 bacterium GW2011_GWF2_37_49]|nr:MAG: hypothetical protein US49_C0001G0091 [candidate division TM6 bacterium GW2011_GWF2_37_49]